MMMDAALQYESTTRSTRLHGRSLWIVRIAWTAVLLLVLSIVAANLPHLLEDTRQEWMVGEALLAARTLFPSTGAFVAYVAALRLIAALVFVGMALFLAWRRSDDWMVLFTSAALMLMIYLFGFTLNVDVIRYPALLEESLPAVHFLFPLLIVAAILGLFYLFPDGVFYPRWIVVFALFGLAISAFFFYAAFNHSFAASWDSFEARNNLSVLPEEWGWWLFVFSLLGSIAAGLLSRLLYFHRAAGPVVRQQMKLVLLGMGALLLGPVLSGVIQSSNLLAYSWRFLISLHIETLLPILLPLSIGAAVLRYRLWDVDVLVNRTLAYGALTAAILLFYGLGVGLAGAILPVETQWFIPALALVIAVLLVWPARGRVQAWANHLLPVNTENTATSATTEESPMERPPWPMKLLQALWVLLLVLLAWQILQRIMETDALVRSMQGEWLVQESLRALPGVDPADFARMLVFGGLWTLAISWLLASFVFRRKKNDGMALYVAYLLLIFPFGVGPGTRPTPLIEVLSFLGLAMGVLFLFIFPDGLFVPESRRWRSALVALILLAPPLSYMFARFLRPEEAPDFWGYAAFIFTITTVMVAGGGGQLYRYRYLSDAVEQRQTRWVLLALALQIFFFLWVALWIGGIPGSLGIPESLLALITLGIMFTANAALPLSLAVAVLVDRLWQMDLVLNRTLVFGGLTALVVLLYVLVVGILGNLFQSGSSLLLSILATGLIAVLFNPLRQRLQQGVNRLMYGQRDDPLAVLSELGRQLENTAVPGETLPALVETIAATLKLPYVAIETAGEDGGRQLVAASASGGLRPAKTIAYPLAYQGKAAGDLLVAPRAAGEIFTPEEERLLSNIARQAGTSVFVEQLTAQLQRERERLVAAREEERLRLRRDLHDGLGPQLATLAVKIDAARNLMGSDPEAAELLLAEVKAESQGAINEIRRVVHGLRPPALDQLGLISALQEYILQQDSASGVSITFEHPRGLPPLPAAVEVAAYRIITEAVTNVVKHSGANNCAIRMRNGDCAAQSKENIRHPTSSIPHHLCIEISDDGAGLPAGYRAGVGLSAMRERAQELGGVFEIESQPGQGTAVRITLPFQP